MSTGDLSLGEILLADSAIASHAAAERFRMLRAKIERRNLRENGKYQLFAVSSAVAQEGKSLTAANLARALSLDPFGKTLIMDSDFRRPAVHKYFKLEIEPGLSDVIQGRCGLAEVIRSVSSQLDVITAGSSLLDPAQAVESPRMAEYLLALKQRYRYIIVDCPPVLLCSEPITISTLVDGTILVVRGWKTDRRLVKDAIEAVGKQRIFGVVLNDVDDVSSDYMAYGYYSDRQRSSIEKTKDRINKEKVSQEKIRKEKKRNFLFSKFRSNKSEEIKDKDSK